jgi:pyruvate/2-oxoacid:ferredoxin oxidoreductase alpha subunit
MSSVNTVNPNVDLTVRIFDEFYNFGLEVETNDYDAVNSFFESVFVDPEAAQNLTVTFFRIAKETNTPVLTLLEQVQGQSAIEVTATLAYYLNGLRSPSTLLGVNVPVTPNFYTARNVMI